MIKYNNTREADMRTLKMGRFIEFHLYRAHPIVRAFGWDYTGKENFGNLSIRLLLYKKIFSGSRTGIDRNKGTSIFIHLLYSEYVLASEEGA